MYRRDFMKLGLKAVVIVGGLATATSLLSSKTYWGFVVDLTKCIGCGKCVQACRAENKVPEGCYRTWVERYVVVGNRILVDSPKMGEEGYTNHPPEVDLSRVKAGFFVPKLCNHCDNAPCVEVCPVDATYLTEDGAVLVDPEVCIGCGYCVQACPYGARYIYPENGPNERMRGIVDKCTWCYHRIQRGLEPACVMACPTKARLFGNLMDPDSVVRQYLNKVGIDVLRPELELRPKVYYYFANLI